MSTRPSVVLVDDGSLTRVLRMLKQIGADHLCISSEEAALGFDPPRDLLITAGAQTFEIPAATAPAAGEPVPTWICFHSQDYLPLRDRLREQGVDLLVQTSLDDASLRLLLLQLLHAGPERRARLRLPLGGKLSYRIGSSFEHGRLAELSAEMCRIYGPDAIAPGTCVSVFLPSELGGGSPLEVQGHALRSVECESRSGDSIYSTVVCINDLDAAARIQLDKIVLGKQIGTRVTALSTPPPPAAEPPPERRGQPRSDYLRNVDLLEIATADAAGATLGHDLSETGVRIDGPVEAPVGSKLSLALYGESRQEPLLVRATVVRSSDNEMALRFDDLSDSEKQQISKLVSGLGAVESLRSGDARSAARVISRVVTSEPR